MADAKTKEADLFAPENTVTVNWGKWDEEGKSYKGVFVEHRVDPSDMTASGQQHVYILVQDDGTKINIPGPGGRPLKPMENVPLGGYVGLRYDKTMEPTKKGQQGAKQIGVYYVGRRELDILRAYQSNTAPEDVFAPEGAEVPTPEEPEM